MKLSIPTKVAQIALLFTILVVSMVSIGHSSQSSNIKLSATGSISYWPSVDIVINISKVIGVNNLSLGFQCDWERWHHLIDRPIMQNLASEANFKLVRIFDFRKTSQWGFPDLMPCRDWATQTWDWTQVDALTQTIFSVGAEPLYCLGYPRENIQNYIPKNMPVNSTTLLPYLKDYAAYTSEWVKHFKVKGWPVRFYEIGNEPDHYFGTSSTKIGYYIDLWNACARAMRAENPNVLISQDRIVIKMVLDAWLIKGDNVNFIDLHKYDAGSLGGYTDAQLFNNAENGEGFTTISGWYSAVDAQQKWLNARGKKLPMICSESNLNWYTDTGTDPKIQQMTGAVWIALVLKQAVVKGWNYFSYFEFCSSKSREQTYGSGGWGFGMVNEDDNKPWYPYFVHKMIGSNLAVGDKLAETKSSSNDVRSIAWLHDEKLNILLICKVDESRTVTIEGVSGQLNVSWIDTTISYQTPSVQTSIISSMESLIMEGYTVALLQTLVTS